MSYAKIVATGHYLPEQVVTNNDLARQVDTSDEWIQQRVGITSRHVASQAETTAFMSIEAAKEALVRADVAAQSVDLIIVATSTADYIMPSCASQVQVGIGAGPCNAFDVAAACSGFVSALNVAEQFFVSGQVKTALVIGAERMSRLMNWSDRSTCVLFGDGAGAVLLQVSDQPGILGSCVHNDGSELDLLYVDNSIPQTAFAEDAKAPYMYMEGRAVFKQAVTALGQLVDDILAQHGKTKADLNWLIPHQANRRIIEATAKKLDMSMDQVILTLGEQGNTSAASVALALHTAIATGKVQPGDLLLLEAFGAGFVWGASLIQY